MHIIDENSSDRFEIFGYVLQVTEQNIVDLISVLEDYKQLRGGIYFVSDLPKTGSGKIAKSELQNIAKTMVISHA